MKKGIFTLLLLASLAVTSQAQDKKFWIGGSLGFESAEVGSAMNLNSFSIRPDFGYRFSDRWGVGLSLGLSNAEANVGTAASAWSQAFSVAPFARYVYLKWKAVTLFTDGGISFTDFTGDVDLVPVKAGDRHITSAGLFINPGFSIRLTDRFSLVGSTNLFSAEHAWDGQTAIWSAGLNSPFNLNDFNLGLNVSF